MNYDNFLKRLLVGAGISGLIYLNIEKFHSQIVGIALLAIYLAYLAKGADLALVKFFNFPANTLRVKVMGFFLAFSFLGFVSAPVAIFFKFSSVNIFYAFLINALIFSALGYWAQKTPDSMNKEPASEEVSEEAPSAKALLLTFFLLLIYGFYLLAKFKTGNAVTSPWQAISENYPYVFFGSVFLLGTLIFTKLKTKAILFLIILEALLLHSYLPLSHKLVYGADQWRHMANEESILQGETFIDAKLAGDGGAQNFNTTIGRFSYGSFWGISVILSRVLSVSLLGVSRWLIPILWSLIIPIIMFELGRLFGWGEKESLFFAWLGFLPFALQAPGSQTLPASLGFVFWSFLLLLLLKRLDRKNSGQILLLLISGLALIFGYALYMILFFLAWGIVEITRVKTRFSVSVWAAVLMALAIPVIELVAKFGAPGEASLAGLKQMAGNFFSVYLASGPRPHDILTGNIIFNQTPLYAFVPNLFTQWRWWLVIFMLAFWALVIAGLIKTFKNKNEKLKVLAIIFTGLLAGYAISNYFLAGERILSRRLDPVIAFLSLAFFFYGAAVYILPKFKWGKTVLFVAVLSAAITASYTLGPDTSTVSANEFDAARYIWSFENSSTAHCALGNTSELLALEAVSGKKIIGGGFPIDEYFGQPERVNLLERSLKNVNNMVLDQVFSLTRAERCWFIGPTANFKQQGILSGVFYKVFGDVAVVRYDKLN